LLSFLFLPQPSCSLFVLFIPSSPPPTSSITMLKVALVCCLLFVSVALASDVRDLNSSNFDQWVDGGTGAFVEFYAPWYVTDISLDTCTPLCNISNIKLYHTTILCVCVCVCVCATWHILYLLLLISVAHDSSLSLSLSHVANLGCLGVVTASVLLPSTKLSALPLHASRRTLLLPRSIAINTRSFVLVSMSRATQR
jgi:hypothetical protein